MTKWMNAYDILMTQIRECDLGDEVYTIAELAGVSDCSGLTAEKAFERARNEGWIATSQGRRAQIVCVPPPLEGDQDGEGVGERWIHIGEGYWGRERDIVEGRPTTVLHENDPWWGEHGEDWVWDSSW
jgi:hypothetical protein